MNSDATSFERKPLISVVIPYYQRDRGVLGRCIRSILSQNGNFDLRVVITDDGSPLAALEELSLDGCTDPRVRVLLQENSGAGSARNKALDNIDPETEYIALMDSDDEWLDGYLACAVNALERGNDLFFSDSRRFSQEKSRFRWEKTEALNLKGDAHLLLDPEESLYQYKGDFFDYMVRRSSIVSSSAMVFRKEKASDLRFNPHLRNGQDRLFKLQLSCRVDKVVFSTRVLCSEGEGINIFDSAHWGSVNALRLSASYIDLAKVILAEIELNDEQKAYVSSQLADARLEFVAGVLHLLRRRKSFDFRQVATVIARDPALLACLITFPVLTMRRRK